jgi:Tol biopolymer transport system component
MLKRIVFVCAIAVGATSLTLTATAMAQTTGHDRNGRIAFAQFDPKINAATLWTARIDGTHRRQLTRTHDPFDPDWSPSGRQIAFDFVDHRGNVHIATIGAYGRDRRQITFGKGIQEEPDWSPAGYRIVFDASSMLPDDPSFSTSIWIMHADGSHPRRITRHGFNVEPVFSPDGSRIAFGRITGTNAKGDQLEALFIVDRDGSHVRRVVAPRAGLEHPGWSPDGRWITFNIEPQTSSTSWAGAVRAVHPNGEGLHTVRSATRHLLFFNAVWSPDGRKLLSGCHDVRDDLDKLCVIDAATGEAHITLSASPNPVNVPAWGPRP